MKAFKRGEKKEEMEREKGMNRNSKSRIVKKAKKVTKKRLNKKEGRELNVKRLKKKREWK